MTILNVSTAPGDFHTIQAAVNAAMNDDTIEIAPGVGRDELAAKTEARLVDA